MSRKRRVGVGKPAALSGVGAAISGSAVVVLLAWLTPSALRTHPGATMRGLSGAPPTAVLTVVVAVAAWLVAGRVVVGSCLLLLGRWLPGAAGRGCQRIGHAVTPRLVRRSLEAALGVALAAAGSGAPAAFAGPPGIFVASPYQAAAAVPAPSVAPPPPALSVRLDRATGGSASWRWSLDRPDVPMTEVGVPSPSAARSPGHPARPLGPVITVRAGDTLWGIARRHLHRGVDAATVAASWPRWYAANRAVIGPDPDLLLPGERLVVPHAVRDVPVREEAP